MIYNSSIFNYYLQTILITFKMATVSTKNSNISCVFMKEKPLEINVTAQLIALQLLIDMDKPNMISPIAMNEVKINQEKNNWEIVLQKNKKIISSMILKRTF